MSLSSICDSRTFMKYTMSKVIIMNSEFRFTSRKGVTSHNICIFNNSSVKTAKFAISLLI